MRTSTRQPKVKKIVIPAQNYEPPSALKKPPPALFLFSNQVGLGRSFNERIS
ncbi:MAG: hypothetical protein J0I12_23465 [Candidatus Eremiobacteraeota bacterium]|nr:hypothetical protein [Candidatus Eremiobacteraeota bacterium]